MKTHARMLTGNSIAEIEDQLNHLFHVQEKTYGPLSNVNPSYHRDNTEYSCLITWQTGDRNMIDKINQQGVIPPLPGEPWPAYQDKELPPDPERHYLFLYKGYGTKEQVIYGWWNTWSNTQTDALNQFEDWETPEMFEQLLKMIDITNPAEPVEIDWEKL